MSLLPLTPRTSDGKPVVLVNLFPGDVLLNYCGRGDGAGIGNGTPFTAQQVGNGATVVEWSFLDWVYIAGGGFSWRNAGPGDHVSMSVYAPATSTSAADPANTGNCNRVHLGGGLYRVDPANGDGTHNVDVSSAVLVPSFDPDGNRTGQWDWSEPDTGKGTATPAETPGAGAYAVYEFPNTLQTFVREVPILASHTVDVTIPAIKIKKLLPHWKMKLTLNVASGATVDFAWWLVLGRKRT